MKLRSLLEAMPVLLLAPFLCRPALAGPHHLVLVGGGAPPPAALPQFEEWAGGRDAYVLIISRAT